MFGKRKKSKPNSDRCERCGHFLVAPGQAWTTRADAQRWERPSGGWSQPPAIKAVRTKSLTRTRLEQSLALGACCTVGLLVLWSPLPLPIKIMLPISAGTFVLSVALGKDNQDGLFKLGSSFLKFLDRNKDGTVDVDDLRDMADDMRERIDDALERIAAPVHQPPPDIQLNTKEGTRPIAGPEPYIVRSLIIRTKTVDQPALAVELDVLCSFIRAAVGLGVWTRRYWTSKSRGDHKLTPDTWQAYFHFFNRNDVGKLWEINPPTPDLPGIIVEFRRWATDQPETDQPTAIKE